MRKCVNTCRCDHVGADLVDAQGTDSRVPSKELACASPVGMLVRAGTLDGTPVMIGGIGGVKTHPQARGQGYASAAMRCAAAALHDAHHVAFSLLVCQAHLLPFYQRLGWLPLAGRLLVEQPGGSIIFTRKSFRCGRPGALSLGGQAQRRWVLPLL